MFVVTLSGRLTRRMGKFKSSEHLYTVGLRRGVFIFPSHRCSNYGNSCYYDFFLGHVVALFQENGSSQVF